VNRSLVVAHSRVGSRRPIARLLGLAPAALLLSGLFTVWAGPLAKPVAAAAGDWSQYHNDPAHSGYNATETTISAANVGALGVAWTATTGNAIYSSPAVANGVVYVGSNDHKLYAFDAAGVTGCSGSPKTCLPLWTGSTTDIIFSSPAVANGVVYIGSDDNKLYAFDAAGITGCSGSPKTCTPLWTGATGNYIRFSSPAVANGVVYVGSDDAKLYAFSLQDAIGATYHAITPTRILDTRDGTGGISGALLNHVARAFQVTGRAVSSELPGGIPSSATAITGNLTVTGQTGLGYLFIGPVGMDNPSSSTLNFPVGDDRANAVTVALSLGGQLSVTYASPAGGATAYAILDVTGYFTPDTTGATYTALTPKRLLDSRDGTGGLSGAFVSHVARTFQVSGGTSVVPANATAVTGNLTVTGQNNLGYLAMGPIAQDNPSSSTLNFPLGDDRANAVTVALGAGGTLSVTYAAPVGGKTAHVIFDVTGFFTPDLTGAKYVPLTPTRILDTRDGTGGLSILSSHVARTFTVISHGGVPSNATAVTGNLTVTGHNYLGYLFIGPAPMNNPTSSTLNFPLGDDRANAVTVALSPNGGISVTCASPAPGTSAHAIFDVTGYFVGP
jgi:hypothetical protein